MVCGAFLLCAGAGGSAGLWWQSRSAPQAPSADEHDVELVLFQAVRPWADPRRPESASSPLHLDAALLLSGGPTSTVVGIGALDRSLDVRARDLPVTISPTDRFQSVGLELVVRDCKGATRWAPSDRPFTVRWRDPSGTSHLDRGGDFDRSMVVSLMRYIDAACTPPATDGSSEPISPRPNRTGHPGRSLR